MPSLSSFRLKRGRGRPPRPVKPTLIQASYYRAIHSVLKTAHAYVKARLVPILGELVARNEVIHADALWSAIASSAAASAQMPVSLLFPFDPDVVYHDADAYIRRDAPMPPGRRVSLTLEAAQRHVDKHFTLAKLEQLAEKAARETAQLNQRNLFRQIKAQLGVDLGNVAREKGLKARMGQFVSENVSLIRSIPKQYLSEVEKVIHAGVKTGERHEALASAVEERFGVAESRAALIARDQVLKFNGSLNKARQTDLGIASYTWRTAEDERVREEHAERDGEVYQWDDPPGDPDDPAEGGHPGTAINCRCTAEPNVEELLSRLEEEDDG